jgi:hypothetical protein
MSNNGDYILFFSNRCGHSKEFLQLLTTDPALDRVFMKVNVDVKGVNIPKCVTKVPSAIIPYNGKPSLLVGNNIFKWFEDNHRPQNGRMNVGGGGGRMPQQQERPSQQQQQQQQQQVPGGIEDYDPLGMTGYSDNFSFIDNQNPLKKAFSFINEALGGGGGGSGGGGGGMAMGGGGDREEKTTRETQKQKELSAAYEKMMNQRKFEVPQGPMRMG